MIEESEQAIISAVMRKPSLLAQVKFDHNDFINETNQAIAGVINDLFIANEVIDLISVTGRLEKQYKNRGWIEIIAKMQGHGFGIPNIRNVSKYIENLKAEKIKLTALTLANNLILEIDSNDNAVDEAIRGLMDLNSLDKNYECSMSEAISASLDMIDSIYQSKGLAGVNTGLHDLNEALGGFQNTDLYVIGARPAMGKTGLLLNMANASGVPSGVISAEQGREQIGLRMLSMNAKVSAHALRLGKMADSDWPKITAAASIMQEKLIRLNDHPGIKLTEVVRQARQWKYQHDIEILYIDYIQRIKANPRLARHEQVGEVAMALKELARELKIPVVALAQVNREVEKRADKRPTMSDLKDSGSIEQEADNIMTLYRDDVYFDNSPDKGIAELNVLKNRHGPTGLVRASWVAQFMLFEDIDKPTYRE